MIKRMFKLIKPTPVPQASLTFDEQKKKENAIFHIVSDLQQAAIGVLTLNNEATEVANLLLEKARELQDELGYKPLYKQELLSFEFCVTKAKENARHIQANSLSISSFYEQLSSSTKRYKTFSEQYIYDLSKVIYAIYPILRH